MSYRLQIHVAGDDPVVVDVDELPSQDANCIVGSNPIRRDGKEVAYIMREVNTVIFPWWRINFIQVLPSETEEEVETFVRE
jgi:hypothetical protein